MIITSNKKNKDKNEILELQQKLRDCMDTIRILRDENNVLRQMTCFSQQQYSQ